MKKPEPSRHPRPTVDEARRLQHSRAVLGEQLWDQVDEITRDFGEQVEAVCSVTLPGDTRKLRGIPAIGRGVSGQLTDEFVPGSDEHLDMLDTLNSRVA